MFPPLLLQFFCPLFPYSRKTNDICVNLPELVPEPLGAVRFVNLVAGSFWVVPTAVFRVTNLSLCDA